MLFKEFGSFRVMYALADFLDGDGVEPLRPVQPLAADAQRRVQAALISLRERLATTDSELEMPSK